MRIALDGLPLCQTLTGIGHYTLQLATHLASAESDDISLLSPRRFLPQLELISPNGNTPRLVRATLNPVIRYWWAMGLPRYLKKNTIELFHGTNFQLPLRTQCPTVVTIHDLSTLLYPNTHEKKNVVRAERRLPIVASDATMVICPTETVRSEVNRELRVPLNRVVAIPEAARDSFQPANPMQALSVTRQMGIGGKFLLYVGTVEPRKNLLTLVRAFEQVVQKHEGQLQLVIAGKRGWLVDDLYAYVKASPAQKQIIFTGYVSDDHLKALYSSCTLFVYPSMYEGFGLPPLEAMKCGAPVVATKISSVAEVVNSAARLVEPTDDSLTGAILELLNDDGLRESLVLAGRQRAALFSWSETARQVRDVYREANERYFQKKKKG